MANKIGDTSMGGDRITKLGEPQVSDDAATAGYVTSQIGATTGIYLKFSGTGSLGVGAMAVFLADVADASYAGGPGYPVPRNLEITDVYVHFPANTADQPVTVALCKNGVATALTVPVIAGFTGVAHHGELPGAGVSFAVNDLIDIKVTAGAGTGDVTAVVIIFGQQAQ